MKAKMLKRVIVISFFFLLILTTICFFANFAIEAYRYDMDPANGVDILEGFAAAIIVMLGTGCVAYEFDLFHVVYYFLLRPKTKIKTIFNILSNLLLLLVLFDLFLVDKFSWLNKVEIVIVVFFFTYVIIRFIYFIITIYDWIKKA